jgi:hypothetical protein
MAINEGRRMSLPQKLNTQLTLVTNMLMLQGQEAVNVTKRRKESILEKPNLPLIHRGGGIRKRLWVCYNSVRCFTSPLQANRNKNKATYWYKIVGIYLSIHVNA